MFMSDASDMAERHGRILAELAELGLGLARELQAQALAAETPAERAEAALAFQRVGRAVRQSIALEAKLERDRVRDARAEAEARDRLRETRTAERRREARLAVEKVIWRTVDSERRAEALRDGLTERIELESFKDDFLDGPAEAAIERLCRSLGLMTPAELDALTAQDDLGGDFTDEDIEAMEREWAEMDLAAQPPRTRPSGPDPPA